MRDTTPEMEELWYRLLFERSREERAVMAFGMFDTAQVIVLASLPPLPPGERAAALFRRFYMNDFTDEEMAPILDAIRAYHEAHPEALDPKE